VAQYLASEWRNPTVSQACFFEDLNEANYRLRAGIQDLLVVNRNLDIVQDQVLNDLIQDDIFQVNPDYCNAILFEVQQAGVAQAFVSVFGVGVGNSSTVIIFWAGDPRG
jgi:hypothetical protein